MDTLKKIVKLIKIGLVKLWKWFVKLDLFSSN